MFEEYLEDASYFAVEARKKRDSREAKRYYRVSVFCAWSAIEAFINFVGGTLKQGGNFPPFEIAFITDKRFGVLEGRFDVLDQVEYHRLEDKLKFLICKFCPSFDFEKNPCWSRILEFKQFRDSLTHPRTDEDETEITEYDSKIKIGTSSIIEMIDCLCQGIFHRPLRKQLKEDLRL